MANGLGGDGFDDLAHLVGRFVAACPVAGRSWGACASGRTVIGMTACPVPARPVPERVVVVGCAGTGRRGWRASLRCDWTRGTSNATRSAMTRLPASRHWSLPPSRPPAGDGCSTGRPTTLRRWCIRTPMPSLPWTIRARSYGAALWLVLCDCGLLAGATGRIPPPPRPGGGGRLPTRCAGLRRRTPRGTRRLPRSLPGQRLPASSDSGSPPHARPGHGSPAFTADPIGERDLSRRARAHRLLPGGWAGAGGGSDWVAGVLEAPAPAVFLRR
jgi:hypothetical protein